jgi:hypothetical protein
VIRLTSGCYKGGGQSVHDVIQQVLGKIVRAVRFWTHGLLSGEMEFFDVGPNGPWLFWLVGTIDMLSLWD